MEKIDIVICPKKENKLKEYQKNYREAKEISFFMDLILYAMFLFIHTLLNLQHLCHPYRLMEIKT